MAPRNSTETMRDICTDTDFFKALDPRGYPAVQDKARPWQKLVSAQKKREFGAVDKMVVICSQNHDHGWSHLHLVVTRATRADHVTGTASLGGY